MPDRWGNKAPWRVVDRRLQSLRKAGKIAYSPKTGWSLAGGGEVVSRRTEAMSTDDRETLLVTGLDEAEFDRLMRDYAQAATHIDGPAMRAGYIALQAYAQAYGDARAREERERCAKLCESFIDGREHARAALAATRALKEGTEREMIDRLSHESMVHLFNRTLERCAAAIRSVAQEKT